MLAPGRRAAPLLSDIEGSGYCRGDRRLKTQSETEKIGAGLRKGIEREKRSKKERLGGKLTLRRLNYESMPRRD